MGRSSAGRYLAGSITLMLEPRDPDGLLPPYNTSLPEVGHMAMLVAPDEVTSRLPSLASSLHADADSVRAGARSSV